MQHTFFEKLQILLQRPKKIAITCHKNPDGDAIGSTLALWHALKDFHHAKVIVPNDFPKFLKWLPGEDKILIYEYNKKLADEYLKEADILFALDYNSLSRIGSMEETVKQIKATMVLIDHHESPDKIFHFVYSDINMSSTCQMVYQTLNSLGILDKMNTSIAECLYTGIMTDTGNFKYPTTTPTTHRIVAHLLEIGVNHTKINDQVYDNNSQSRLKLLGRTLENMVLLPEKKTAYMFLGHIDLDKYQFKKGDTEGFVNYGLSIEGILFSVIFIEDKEEGIIKISFRSKGDFSVNQFARAHFNGGGHKNAAGGRSEEGLKKTIQKFLRIVESEHP